MHRDMESNSALEQALCRLYQSEEPPAGFETGWRAAVRREESMMRMAEKSTRRPLWRAIVPACAALVLVVGSLWAGTLDLEGSAPSEKSAATGAGYADSASTTSYSASNAMMARSADTAVYDLYVAEESGASTGGTSAADAGTEASAGQKLVRTASLTLRTTAFEADLESVQALLDSLGGYVENLYQYGDVASGDTRTASLSVRVPSENLDAFLSGVEGVGRVTDRSESVTDMTVQYTDNQARLDTLYAKMERLNQLMAQAQEVSDLIELESAIADTQYEIERYETSQRDIDRRVDMSAVNVTLLEDGPAQSATAEDVGLGERLGAALNASLRWLGGFLRNMLVFITMILPVAVPVAAIAAAAWLIVRRRRSRSPKDDSKEE
mgnify:CR=1 FL=1